MDKYLEAIINFLKENADRELPEMNENSHLVDDLGFNSIEMLMLVNEAENVFEITIDDDDIAQMSTVSDLVTILKDKNGKI